VNQRLPPGNRGHRSPTSCWASRRGRTVPGAGGLVGGIAAAAGEPRIGHRGATFGPRWLLARGLGASAKAVVTPSVAPATRDQRKSPPRREPGGQEGSGAALRVNPVAALALVGFERLNGVPGLLHRAGHEPEDWCASASPSGPLSAPAWRRSFAEHRHHPRRLAAFARPGGFLGLGGPFRSGRLLRQRGIRVCRGLLRRALWLLSGAPPTWNCWRPEYQITLVVLFFVMQRGSAR
jgi:hypothetical protein